jgi:hypothetical protein
MIFSVLPMQHTSERYLSTGVLACVAGGDDCAKARTWQILRYSHTQPYKKLHCKDAAEEARFWRSANLLLLRVGRA